MRDSSVGGGDFSALADIFNSSLLFLPFQWNTAGVKHTQNLFCSLNASQNFFSNCFSSFDMLTSLAMTQPKHSAKLKSNKKVRKPDVLIVMGRQADTA